MFEKVKAAFGFGSAEQGASAPEISGRLIPTPPAEALLPVTDHLKASWDEQARITAREVASLTTAQINRDFPGLIRPQHLGETGVLPGEPDDRTRVVESALRRRLESDYGAHVKEVDELLTAPDREVRDRLWLGADEPVPGLRDPRARADFISMTLLDLEKQETGADRHAQDMAALRRFGPSNDDWHEHMAGEPALQFYRAEGEHDLVAQERSRFFASHRIDDPSLQEIVQRAMEVTESRDPQALKEDLASGQIFLGPDRMDIAVAGASTAFVDQPVERGAFLALMIMSDYKERHPEAAAAWDKEAREILAEDQSFIEHRYGMPVDKGSLVLHDVIVLEMAAKARDIHEAMHPEIERDRQTPLVVTNEKAVGIAAAPRFDPAIVRAGQGHGIS